MTDKKGLTNAEICQLIEKYAKFKYKAVGMYFLEKMPQGKYRKLNIFNRCIPGQAFAAAARGKVTHFGAGRGCPGGLWWTGFSKYPPRGITVFLSYGGRWDCFGGRGEHLKKTPAIAARVLKYPGPVKIPSGMNYYAFQRLKEIPDDQKIEYVVFFVTPTELMKLVNLIHFTRGSEAIIRVPAGSGCMSLVNFPLMMKDEPDPDAILGLFDPVARRHVPKNILSVAMRRWLVEDFVKDIKETFLVHAGPFTIKGELSLLFKKWKHKRELKAGYQQPGNKKNENEV